MITGLHALVYAQDAVATRAFFKDVLKLPCVDVDEGWLIFAAPPTELAAHPAEDDHSGTHELYLMCDDVKQTMAELQGQGIKFTQPVKDQGWGLVTRLKVPGGGEMGLYEPKHALAHRAKRR